MEFVAIYIVFFFVFCVFVGYLHWSLMVFGFAIVMVVIFMGVMFFHRNRWNLCFFFSTFFVVYFSWGLIVFHGTRCYLCGCFCFFALLLVIYMCFFDGVWFCGCNCCYLHDFLEMISTADLNS